MWGGSRFVAVFALMFAFALPSAGQTPRVEVFGGYSFARLNQTSDIAPVNAPGGWHTSVAANFNSWLAISGDISGHYRTVVPGISTNLHLFTFGPRFTSRASQTFQPFGHVHVGGARVGVEVSPFNVSDGSFATIAGGGLDIKVRDRIAIRAAQFDYVFTRFGISQQHSFRFSAGVVFRLGSK